VYVFCVLCDVCMLLEGKCLYVMIPVLCQNGLTYHLLIALLL